MCICLWFIVIPWNLLKTETDLCLYNQTKRPQYQTKIGLSERIKPIEANENKKKIIIYKQIICLIM